jgi:putative addiction module component (TIGR02574 family)
MSLTIEQLAEEALALPANARAQLVDRLVESLDPAEDVSFRQLWATEALRRRDEVRSGRVQTIPGEEAIKLARKAASG